MGPVPQPDEERDHPNHNENNIEDAGKMILFDLTFLYFLSILDVSPSKPLILEPFESNQ